MIYGFCTIGTYKKNKLLLKGIFVSVMRGGLPGALCLLLGLCFSTRVWGQAAYTIIQDGNKVGLVNAQGQEVLPATYHALGWSRGAWQPVGGVIGFQRNGLWGLVNLEGKRLCRPEYTFMQPFAQQYVVAGRKAYNAYAYTLLNLRGKPAFKQTYALLAPVQGVLLVGRWQGNTLFYGLMNAQEKLLCPMAFTSIKPLGQGLFAATTPGGAVRLYNLQGQWQNNFEADSIGTFDKGLATYFFAGKCGLVDAQGVQRLPNQYRRIKVDSGQIRALTFPAWRLYTAERKALDTLYFDSVGFVNTGVLVARTPYTDGLVINGQYVYLGGQIRIERFNKGVAAFTQKGRYGLLNNEGAVLIEPVYDSLYGDGQIYHALTGNKWYLFNKAGGRMGRTGYARTRHRADGVVAVQQNGLWGYVDYTGRPLTSYKFDSAGPFVNEYARVVQFGQPGIINRRGQWVVPPGRHEVKLLKNRQYMLVKPGGTRVYTYAGQVLFETPHRLAPCGMGWLLLRKDGLMGYVNRQWQQVLSAIYKDIKPLDNVQRLMVRENGYWSLRDASGRVLIAHTEKLEEAFETREGYVGVKINGRYGFMDELGRLRIANRYDGIGPFSEGLAAMKLRHLWGYLNVREKIAIQPQYDSALTFKNGVAWVKTTEGWGLIDTKNVFKIKPQFDAIAFLPGGSVKVFKNNLQGILWPDGAVKVRLAFEHIEKLPNGYYKVGRQQDYGLLAPNGTALFPVLYSSLSTTTALPIYVLTKLAAQWQVFEADVILGTAP